MTNNNQIEKTLAENAKHTCPYTKEPCNSLACAVRNNGVCNILEVSKHEGVEEAAKPVHMAGLDFVDDLCKEVYYQGEPAHKAAYSGFLAGASFVQSKLTALQDWKESAMQVMNDLDLQAIGKELNIPLGQDIANKVLDGIKGLKEENERLKAFITAIRDATVTGGLREMATKLILQQ